MHAKSLILLRYYYFLTVWFTQNAVLSKSLQIVITRSCFFALCPVDYISGPVYSFFWSLSRVFTVLFICLVTFPGVHCLIHFFGHFPGCSLSYSFFWSLARVFTVLFIFLVTFPGVHCLIHSFGNFPGCSLSYSFFWSLSRVFTVLFIFLVTFPDVQ